MQRIISILLSLLFCVSLPFALYAAAEEPYCQPFQAVVSNKQGAELYEDVDVYRPDPVAVPANRTLPKGTTVTVTSELALDDAVYYYAFCSGGYYYLNSRDVTEEFVPAAPNSEYRYDPPQHYVVMRDGGLDLHEAPHETAPSVGTVPKGTVVTATHADIMPDTLYDEQAGFSVWSYVTYNGKSGWLSTNEYTGDCARSVKYRDTTCAQLGKCTTTVPMKLYDRIDGRLDDDAKVVATVPAGTELTYDVYSSPTNALISYNGKQGWADPFNSDAIVSVDGACMPVAEMPIYRSPESGKKNMTGQTAPVFELLQYDQYFVKTLGEADSEYVCEYWYHIVSDDAEGWLLLPSGSFPGEDLIEFEQAECFRLPERNHIPVYASPYGGERIMTLEGGSVYYWLFRYDDWDYVQIADDEYGWTQIDETEGWLPGRTLYSLHPTEPDEDEVDEQSAAEETVPAQAETKKWKNKSETASGDIDNAPGSPSVEKPELFSAANIGMIGGAAAILLLVAIGVIRARKRK